MADKKITNKPKPGQEHKLGNTITARHEQSNDGVNWLPWMNVKLTREK